MLDVADSTFLFHFCRHLAMPSTDLILVMVAMLLDVVSITGHQITGEGVTAMAEGGTAMVEGGILVTCLSDAV